MQNFIRTVTINGKPLVLRFNQISEEQIEVSCLNDKNIDMMILGTENLQWKILSGGSEEMLENSARIIDLMN